MARVKVNLNKRQITRKIERQTEKAEVVLKDAVLGDSNEYVPVDLGELRDSARINRDGVAWTVPYAARQYYENPVKISRRNSKGTWRWFEHAKKENIVKWIRKMSREGKFNIKLRSGRTIRR